MTTRRFLQHVRCQRVPRRRCPRDPGSTRLSTAPTASNEVRMPHPGLRKARDLLFQRVEPAELREAGKIGVVGVQLGLVFDRQGRQLCVRREVLRRSQGA